MRGEKVVDLNGCRDLLQQWAAVRDSIIQGHVKGLAVCLQDETGRETVKFAGSYSTSTQAALSAVMAISWDLTKQEDAIAARGFG